MILLTPIRICLIFLLVFSTAAKPLTSEASSPWQPSEDQHTLFTHTSGPHFDAVQTAYPPDWNRMHKLSAVIENAEGELEDGDRYKGHVHEMLKALNLYQAVRRAITPNDNNQTKDTIHQSGLTSNPIETSFDQSASRRDSWDQSETEASDRCQCFGKRTGRVLTGPSEDQSYLSSSTLMAGVVGAMWTALAAAAVYYKAQLSDSSSSSEARSLGDWNYQDTNSVDVDGLLGSLRTWPETGDNGSHNVVCSYLQAVWDQEECRRWLSAGWENSGDWTQSSSQSAESPDQEVPLMDQKSTRVKRWALWGEGSQQGESVNFMKRMGTIIQSRTGRALGTLQSAVSRRFGGQSSITNRLSRLWTNKISRSWNSAKDGALKGLRKLANVSSKVVKSAKNAMKSVQRRIAPYSTEAAAEADRRFAHRTAEENPYFTETSSSSNVFENFFGSQYSEYQERSEPSAHHYPDYGYHGDDYCDCDGYGHGAYYPDYDADLYGETGYSSYPDPDTELLEHGITALITSSLWIPAIYLIYLLGSSRSRTLPNFLRFGGPELPANRGTTDQLEGENFISSPGIGGLGPTYHNLDSDELANTLTININMPTDRAGNSGSLRGVNVTALPGEDVNVDFLPSYDDVEVSGDNEEEYDEEAYDAGAYDETGDSEYTNDVGVVRIVNGNITPITFDDTSSSDNLTHSVNTSDVSDSVNLDGKSSKIEQENPEVHGNTTNASNTSTHTFEPFTVRDGVVTLQTPNSENELSREDKEQIASDSSNSSDIIGMISRHPGQTNILKFGGSATRFAIMNTGTGNATVILPEEEDRAEGEEQHSSGVVTSEEGSGAMLEGEDVQGGQALGVVDPGEGDVGALPEEDDLSADDEVVQDKEGMYASNSGTVGIAEDDASHSEDMDDLEQRANKADRDASIFRSIDNFISRLNSRLSQAV